MKSLKLAFRIFIPLCLFACSKIEPPALSDNTIDLIVFSYDRPLQLYAFLESAHAHMSHVAETKVIYRVSDPSYEQGYAVVKRAFPDVKWVKQTPPFKDLQTLVLRSLKEGPSAYTAFAVDDIIVTGKVDAQECVSLLQKTGAYGFFLRLGKNIDHCYMLDAALPLPPSTECAPHVFAWHFEEGKLEWKYPNTLDLTIYQKAEIVPVLEDIHFTTPYDMESHWMQRADDTKQGLYYEQSKMINIPLNLVHASDNRHMNAIQPKELLEKLEQGLKIDITPFYEVKNPSAHIDYPITLIDDPHRS